MIRETIQVESSRYTDGAYWLYGAEYYAVDVEIEYPDDLDTGDLSEDELLQMADDEENGVRYVHTPAKEQEAPVELPF